MEMRYRTLLSLNHHFRTGMTFVEEKGHQRRQTGTISQTPSKESPISPKRTSSKPTASQSLDQPPTVNIASTVDATLAKMDEHTMLFRGSDIENCEHTYIESTGELKLDMAYYHKGGFSGREKSLSYWTPQRETADRYVRWAKNRSLISGVSDVQIEVSGYLLD